MAATTRIAYPDDSIVELSLVVNIFRHLSMETAVTAHTDAPKNTSVKGKINRHTYSPNGQLISLLIIIMG